MANMTPVKTPARELSPEIRSKCFDEVAFAYTDEEAALEASRCLNCKNPLCVTGCPVGVRIPNFIKLLADGDLKASADSLLSDNALPSVCGRVCPQENQCESKCVRGVKGEPVAIGRLERYVADKALYSGSAAPAASQNGKRVAVIGSGPSGLTCAGELAKKGFDVTVYEALHKAGGVLRYGIPEFRLPKKIVDAEIEKLRDLGVKIELDSVIGAVYTVDELLENGFSAVYVATGAGLPNFSGVPGESLVGVSSANEYLTRVNLMKGYDKRADTPVIKSKNVIVIGGGNVAMDAARSALRMGAESVTVVYRRSDKELPARAEEVHHAMEEGIVFHFLAAPVEYLGDENGRVRAARCIKMELSEPDASGRRRPVPIAGSEFEIAADTVIVAIGTSPNPLIRNTTAGLDTDRKGCIVTDEFGRTSKKGVYAGGDASTGAATVILAMGAGKKAAAAIAKDLS